MYTCGTIPWRCHLWKLLYFANGHCRKTQHLVVTEREACLSNEGESFCWWSEGFLKPPSRSELCIHRRAVDALQIAQREKKSRHRKKEQLMTANVLVRMIGMNDIKPCTYRSTAALAWTHMNATLFLTFWIFLLHYVFESSHELRNYSGKNFPVWNDQVRPTMCHKRSFCCGCWPSSFRRAWWNNRANRGSRWQIGKAWTQFFEWKHNFLKCDQMASTWERGRVLVKHSGNTLLVISFVSFKERNTAWQTQKVRVWWVDFMNRFCLGERWQRTINV